MKRHGAPEESNPWQKCGMLRDHTHDRKRQHESENRGIGQTIRRTPRAGWIQRRIPGGKNDRDSGAFRCRENNAAPHSVRTGKTGRWGNPRHGGIVCCRTRMLSQTSDLRRRHMKKRNAASFSRRCGFLNGSRGANRSGNFREECGGALPLQGHWRYRQISICLMNHSADWMGKRNPASSPACGRKRGEKRFFW